MNTCLRPYYFNLSVGNMGALILTDILLIHSSIKIRVVANTL